MKRYFTLVILFFALGLAGCNSDDPVRRPTVDTDPKTFIMFGKISGFSGNVYDAQKAVANGALIEGQRLLIYQDTSKELFEVIQDKTQATGYRKEVVKSYNSSLSCLNPVRMRTILEDAIAAAPANHYGLSIGTHGTGWVHKGLRSIHEGQARYNNKFAPLFKEADENSMTRDVNGEINIEDMADVLEGLGFDFILLDQCLMAGAEVVYEMRNTAPYLIVSPAEILMTGFPFDRVIPAMFNDWDNLVGVCQQYLNHYANYSCSTISLVKTSEVEALMQSVKAIVDNGTNTVGQAGLQCFYDTGIFYDLGQYIEALSTNSTLTQAFKDQLKKVVVFTGTNGYYYRNSPIDKNHYSGLTVYVPEPALYPMYYASYQETSWYKAVNGI